MQALVRTILDPKRLFLGILLLGIFTLAARNITDPDFWWHLRTGQYIVETHSIPHTDPFSFTRAGYSWIAHEWLSELLIYSVYRAAGWGGLIVVFAGLTSATFFLLYLRCSGQPYVAGVLVLWAAFACRPTWGVRPHTISFLFASLLLWILERPRDQRALWWTVPLTFLWANLHAGYSLGIALLVLFLIGGWLDGVFGFTSSTEIPTHTRSLALTIVLSLAVVVLNPSGWRLYGYPFTTLHSAAMQNHIAEWFSPNFHQAEYAPLLAMLLATLVLPALTTVRIRPRTVLLVCVSAYAALQSVRFVPIFALIATPLLAEHAEAWTQSQRWHHSMSDGSALTRPKLAFHSAVAVILVVFTCVQVRQVVRRQAVSEAIEFPAAAADFLREQRAPGPLFNDYNWGGYLMWKLYPGTRVFIDGRADLYGDEFMEQFSATYNLTGDWQRALDRWQIATVIVPSKSPLATALPASGVWKPLFHDPQVVVLARIGTPRARN